jgi:hypothetical protein
MGTSTARQMSLETGSLDGIHWLGILAALVTAAIHLLLGVRPLLTGSPSGLAVSFVLAGLGFLGAVVLVLVNYRRRTVYAVGIPYTLAQLGLWYYFNFAAGPKSFPADVGTLGAVDKVTQVVLVVVLVVLLR